MTALRSLRLGWALMLVGALTWGLLLGHGTWPALSGRMASSVLLVAAAVVAWRLTGDRLVFWTLSGIGFGALGDVINAGLLPGGTLAGMGAFGIGHVCYVTGIIGALGARRVMTFRTTVSVFLWLLVGLLGWYAVVLLAPPRGLEALVWPALGYTLLLSATAGCASALALADRAFRLLALGAALFLLSDLILAVELFRGRFPQDTLAVWIPYGVGQMLIVFTAARQAVHPELESP